MAELSKEEILKKYLEDKIAWLQFPEETQETYKAMQQYADQEKKKVSIEFAEWMEKNCERWENVWSFWDGIKWNYNLTTEQLYSLFEQQKTK